MTSLRIIRYRGWVPWQWSSLCQLNLESTRAYGLVGCKVPTDNVKISIKVSMLMNFFIYNYTRLYILESITCYVYVLAIWMILNRISSTTFGTHHFTNRVCEQSTDVTTLFQSRYLKLVNCYQKDGCYAILCSFWLCTLRSIHPNISNYAHKIVQARLSKLKSKCFSNLWHGSLVLAPPGTHVGKFVQYSNYVACDKPILRVIFM